MRRLARENRSGRLLGPKKRPSKCLLYHSFCDESGSAVNGLRIDITVANFSRFKVTGLDGYASFNVKRGVRCWIKIDALDISLHCLIPDAESVDLAELLGVSLETQADYDFATEYVQVGVYTRKCLHGSIEFLSHSAMENPHLAGYCSHQVPLEMKAEARGIAIAEHRARCIGAE